MERKGGRKAYKQVATYSHFYFVIRIPTPQQSGKSWPNTLNDSQKCYHSTYFRMQVTAMSGNLPARRVQVLECTKVQGV